MTIYLIRHGQDDETVRGGWANTRLTHEGIIQINKLSESFKDLPLDCIYSSDLIRAVETTEILHKTQPNLPIIYNENLREINNGLLAGMPNKDAEVNYPGLFYRKMDWTERYPEGESPEIFYHRIVDTWENMINANKRNIAIVTHGGVINIILHHIKGLPYSNKNISLNIPTGSMTIID